MKWIELSYFKEQGHVLEVDLDTFAKKVAYNDGRKRVW